MLSRDINRIEDELVENLVMVITLKSSCSQVLIREPALSMAVYRLRRPNNDRRPRLEPVERPPPETEDRPERPVATERAECAPRPIGLNHSPR